MHFIRHDGSAISMENLHLCATRRSATGSISFLSDHEDRIDIVLGHFVVVRVLSSVQIEDFVVDPFDGHIVVNIEVPHRPAPVILGDCGLVVHGEDLVRALATLSAALQDHA